MAPRSSTSRCAFTLVELLVVVSIIALLVSILLPSLSRARELAKASVCASNLSGLGKAMLFYQSRWGGLLPMGHINSGNPDNLPEQNWWDFIQSDAGSRGGYSGTYAAEGAKSIFKCPSAKSRYKFLTWGIPVSSYAINAELLPCYWNQGGFWSRRVNPDKIYKPARTLLLLDSIVGANPSWFCRTENDFTTAYIWGVGPKPVAPDESTDAPVARYWHGNQDEVNILMADYHVAAGMTATQCQQENYQNTTIGNPQ